MAEQWQEDLAGIPILGWLTGADAAVDRSINEDERAKAEYAWRQLMGGAPSAEDLTPEYRGEGTADEYGDLLMGPSGLEGMDPNQAQKALDALGGLIDSGGYTDADRQAAAAARAANAQQVGAMNRAAQAGMEARGIGGSGAAMAAQMGGSQNLANANMQSNAALQQAAMQRAMQAMQGYGQLGSTMYGQEMARRNAIDAYNQSNYDWRRGREQRNTGWANRQQDATTGARQQAYQNRESATAGITGQYAGNINSRQGDAARQDDANATAANAVGTLITEIL